jgi:hypothetical protein
MSRARTIEAIRADAEKLGYAVVPKEPTETMMNAGLYQASHDARWEDVWQSYVDMVRVADQ